MVVKWYFIRVLFCFTPITINSGQFFMRTLATYTYFLLCLFKAFAHLLIGLSFYYLFTGIHFIIWIGNLFKYLNFYHFSPM